MVAAWISAETGVGPARRRQPDVERICALLPVAPMNRQSAMNRRGRGRSGSPLHQRLVLPMNRNSSCTSVPKVEISANTR